MDALKRSYFNPLSVETFNRQLKKVMLLVIIVFGILVLRLWFLQIVNGSTFRTKSEINRIHLQDIPPFRGQIFDRNGEILVDNRPAYDLYVIPEEVLDRDKLVESLGRLIHLQSREIVKKLDEASRRQPFKPVCIKRDISRDELAKVETHRFNLPGVMTKVSPKRRYIWGDFACHLLGYLGEISDDQLKNGQFLENKPGDLVGKQGVELKLQSFLSGVRGGEQVEVDATGRRIRVISQKSSVPGANIYLTIDKNLQALAEKYLTGKEGAIIAIDPSNGDVLASASSPFFDPNLFVGGIDEETWREIVSSEEFVLQDRVVSGVYPPGSVFKIVVALAGLEEGLIDPKEKVFCNGRHYVGRREYRCWRRHGHGKIDLHRALVESCDIYFYTMGQRLGVEKIAYYAKKFGLGKATGIGLGNEKEGLIPTSEWKLKKWGTPWQTGETVCMAIGQSFVLVTPIQMAVFIAALFNGGNLYEPKVTLFAEKPGSGEFQDFEPKLTGNIEIKAEHMELIKDALIGVVNESGGTGFRARLKGITVAGKTGTAQVVSINKDSDKSTEVPESLRDHAWFVAVAPAREPKIAVTVVIEHGGHGGSAAAPIAREIIRVYLDSVKNQVMAAGQ
jgi:penicillin-binding protein 2